MWCHRKNCQYKHIQTNDERTYFRVSNWKRNGIIFEAPILLPKFHERRRRAFILFSFFFWSSFGEMLLPEVDTNFVINTSIVSREKDKKKKNIKLQKTSASFRVSNWKRNDIMFDTSIFFQDFKKRDDERMKHKWKNVIKSCTNGIQTSQTIFEHLS